MAEWLVNQIPSNADADATTTLSSTLTAGATSMSVASETKMPTAGYTARAVLSYGSSAEIVAVTGAASGPYTITRAQEGTSASEWPTGTQVNVTMTAAGLLNWIQANDFSPTGIWTFTNYVDINALNVSGILSALGTNDGSVAMFFSTTDGDSIRGISVQDVDSTNNSIYFSGRGKVSTDADVMLELKSGTGSTTNQSYVYLNGGQRHKAVNKTADYAMDAGDHTVVYTTLAAARAVTLPALSAVADNQEFEVLDATTGTHADTNNLTVQRTGTDLFVGGGTNTVISTANGYRRIKKVNSRWMVVGSG